MSGKVQVSPQQEKRNRKTKCFALGHPPDPKNHFYIPSAADVEYIVKNMTKTSNQYLVRGPPACGKTTLAEALCRRYPYTKRGDDCSDDCEPSFVLIHGENLEDAKEPITFIEELKTATHGDLDADKFKPAFNWLNKRNVIMVIDEAQIVFKNFFSKFKNSGATAIFFTTTPEAAMANQVANEDSEIVWQYSPSEIAKKFYWSGGIDDTEVVEALKQTNARLEPKAVQALVQISGVHRGVFVRLCDWVEQHQLTEQA